MEGYPTSDRLSHRQVGQSERSKLIKGQRPTEEAGLSLSLALQHRVPFRHSSRGRNLVHLIRQIRDYNADASKAISNILRLANNGMEVKVYEQDGETPNEEGQRLVDEMIDPMNKRLAREYGGGAKVLLDMVILTAATQGAVAIEAELDDQATSVHDIVPVNPYLIDFELDEDKRWVPGIRRLGQFKPLHPLQFLYIPIDPDPGDPRGRSPFWAALDVIFFQMEVLQDLKASAHFAGYPRIDISVALESVLESVQKARPDLLEPTKHDELMEFLDQYLGDITDTIDDLEPDDAFVHWDSVNAEYTVPSGRPINLQELVQAIDSQIVSGLKQLPVLLGRNEGATTTHATVQWQVYVQELKAFQAIAKHVMEWGMGLALRVEGIQGVVDVGFEQIRTYDRKAEADAEQVETATKIMQRDAGWIDNDEAAMEVVGHEAVGEQSLASVTPEQEGEIEEEGEDEGSELSRLGLRLLRSLVGENKRQPAEGPIREEEDVRHLPVWQQSLYFETEGAIWDTYRTQTRRAWDRMEETLRNGEAPDPPEPDEERERRVLELLARDRMVSGANGHHDHD